MGKGVEYVTQKFLSENGFAKTPDDLMLTPFAVDLAAFKNTFFVGSLSFSLPLYILPLIFPSYLSLVIFRCLYL
jgi:hypothetical protein